ncbi:MAG: TIGR00341 family protein, partial [Ginsengibacter sp.]
MDIKKILEKFNLKSEQEEHNTIHEIIEKGVHFKSTNLWILIFAIMIACVGLNMNSTAVVIGAMLISPLMGPIIGIGFSLGTYDFLLLRRSFVNFGFAVFSGLFASTVYFLLTPISEAHSELLARTQPNIYDVLIAFFGGLAGIIAVSSKQKGNVIPGVAIATALMPPLCTAGYGLATGTWTYFFGAFYLFAINSVFIATATLITVRLLKYPKWRFAV